MPLCGLLLFPFPLFFPLFFPSPPPVFFLCYLSICNALIKGICVEASLLGLNFNVSTCWWQDLENSTSLGFLICKIRMIAEAPTS